MEQLGLGYDAVRAINPDIIIASPCLMGEDGPAARSAGYGHRAAAVCGFYQVTGWSDRPPGGPFGVARFQRRRPRPHRRSGALV
jgi:benzylsuccinate CoA-transferase BbsF subunit